MALSPEDFQFVSNLVKARSGIHLAPDKSYLLDSRLLPIIRKRALSDVNEFINNIKSTGDEVFITELIEAITTNESSFFRDIKPFDQFKNVVMPNMIAAHPAKKHFQIWSAACSTGQEPYSIAMTILENPQWSANLTFEIIATDIAQHVLNRAEAGSYSQFEVQRGLPVNLLLKYFTQSGETWTVKDSIKSMVKFKRYNLTEDLSPLGTFDIIMCRNVLIYFDLETKMKVLNNISKLMLPHAALTLGCTESLHGIENKFQLLKDTTGFFTLK